MNKNIIAFLEIAAKDEGLESWRQEVIHAEGDPTDQQAIPVRKFSGILAASTQVK